MRCSHYLASIESGRFDTQIYERQLAGQAAFRRVDGSDPDKAWAYVTSSDWDTRVLEKKTLIVTALFWQKSSDPEEEIALLDDLARHIDQTAADAGAQFLFFRLGSALTHTAQVFSQRGWNLVDTLLVFQYAAARGIGRRNGCIRAITAEDRDAVRDIARAAIQFGRIHSDIHLPQRAKQHFYDEMAASYSQRQEEGEVTVRVLTHDTEIGGFYITCPDETASAALGEAYGCLSLIAVAPDHQGKGFGQQLLADALAEAEGRFRLMEISTQIDNRRAVALYQQTGLDLAGGIHSFHKHLP
jgi:GNAT superfamily N-acetyltransferase